MPPTEIEKTSGPMSGKGIAKIMRGHGPRARGVVNLAAPGLGSIYRE
jgi:hypothetical protein